jgi:hypothetical protein
MKAALILTRKPVVFPSDHYVYLHRRATTGEICYVGKGVGGRAWWHHDRNRYWCSVARKHGLTVEIVCDGLREWAANELEAEWIMRVGRERLCNLTDGGDGVSGMVVTDEYRQKLKAATTRSWAENPVFRERRKESNARYWADPQAREKRSRTMLEVCAKPEVKARMTVAAYRRSVDPEIQARLQAVMVVVRQRPEVKAKYVKATLAKWADPNCKLRASRERAVRCIETGQVFRSGVLAMPWVQSLGYKSVKPSHIYQACLGNIKQAFGYHWEYA